MQICDIMTQGVECIRPDASIEEAACKMRDLDIGVLPVCGHDDRLAGMITDRDIAIRGVAEGKDPRSAKISDVMTPEIVYCFEDQDVSEAAQVMEERQVRRIVVLNRDKRLVGIVSLGDLAVKTRNETLTGEAVEAICEPAHS